MPWAASWRKWISRFEPGRRFEPGKRKRVTLGTLSGEGIVYGGNGWTGGQLEDAGKKLAALEKLG